jgi:hypothetical protein
MPEVAVTVAQAIEQLSLTVWASPEQPETPVAGALVGDLLSYIMAHGKRGQLWITIQTHPNVVAVATLAGLSGVILAGGFEPAEETTARAEEEGVALLGSADSAFTLAGKLYELGVR